MMPDSDSTGFGVELYPYLGLGVLVFAAGLFVVGVTSLTICEPTVIVPGFPNNTVNCVFPFHLEGLTFLYLGALLTILSFNVFVHYGIRRGLKWNSETSPMVVSLLFAIASTVLFVMALAFW